MPIVDYSYSCLLYKHHSRVATAVQSFKTLYLRAKQPGVCSIINLVGIPTSVTSLLKIAAKKILRGHSDKHINPISSTPLICCKKLDTEKAVGQRASRAAPEEEMSKSSHELIRVIDNCLPRRPPIIAKLYPRSHPLH